MSADRLTLTAREAARLLGCKSMATFYRWQKIGLVPKPIPGTHSYAKGEIHAALDRVSGVRRTVANKTAFEEWLEHEDAA